jgi:hypothetical protein
LLSWGIEDATLRKLETYRLYQAGISVNLSEMLIEFDDFGRRGGQAHSGHHVDKLLENTFNRL